MHRLVASTVLRSCTSSLGIVVGRPQAALRHCHPAAPRILLQHAPTPRAQVTAFSTAALDDIILTPQCIKQLAHIAEKAHVDESTLKLRVAVQEGGCGGFEYAFSIDHDPLKDDDELFEQRGARVVVDEVSLGFLRGCTITFEDEMVGQRFAVMNNPNSASACGCGTSFAPKEAALGVPGIDEDSDDE